MCEVAVVCEAVVVVDVLDSVRGLGIPRAVLDEALRVDALESTRGMGFPFGLASLDGVREVDAMESFLGRGRRPEGTTGEGAVGISGDCDTECDRFVDAELLLATDSALDLGKAGGNLAVGVFGNSSTAGDSVRVLVNPTKLAEELA